MNRQTIDYGIDLGTTNSAIAVLNGTEVQIIKSATSEVQMDYTPSAVWFDHRGRIKVGRVARERLSEDPENVATEFKLKMGTNYEYAFPHAPNKMTPEALSAEVLKDLRNDAKVAMTETVEAAVITVPAAFELPQCAATTRAAEAAGFTTSRLLQEPSAAALAYGFQSESDNVFWLVYDLGGGTFDAAVVRVRDGEISVVNHEGDNHLGGKFLDWEIVDRLLIPAVVKQHQLEYFERNNVEWRAAIALLKYHAEIAKIRLSGTPEQEIEIEGLRNADRSRTFDFNFTLRRADVERLFDPYIDRTIRLCRKALEAKNLSPDKISKLLLVGGPTLTPYLRERLKDPKNGLGIPLDFRVDPLTVVARGAAIFAGTQRFESQKGPSVSVPAGAYSLDLQYSSMGTDPEPPVGGRLQPRQGESLAGFTIEFVNKDAQPTWRSGKVGLSAEGVFMTQLWAEKGKASTYFIELRDGKGDPCATDPDRITYTFGAVFKAPPLIKSLSVALANNQTARFLEKGIELPAKKREILYAAVEVRPGEKKDMLRIPLMEGEHERADRNQEIGTLIIQGENVTRPLTAGSEIEVLVDIDESRNIRFKAYVPILDEEFEAKIDYDSYHQQARDPAKLQHQIAAERRRLEEARGKAQQQGVKKAQDLAQKIDSERTLVEAEQAAEKAKNEADEADRCEQRLLELRAAVDQVEDALAWPQLVAEAEKELETERRILNTSEFKATSEEKEQFSTLEQELRQAIENRDADMVRRQTSELDRLGARIVLRQPAWWVNQLERLAPRVSQTTDPAQAQKFVDLARRAINNDDIEGLRAAVRQLISLLPSGDAEQAQMLKSGVTK